MTADIDVTLIDAATQLTLDRVRVPADRLPETFARETTLHLGDLEWRVEAARPDTREAYVREGALELRLRRVERVDPQSILYSLPTIEDALPACDGADVGEADLVLHEDDWRQLELVSRAHEDALDRELDAIAELVRDHRAGAGYRKLHVRAQLPRPIAPGALRLEQVGAVSPRRLALAGHAGAVRGGFVVELAGGAALYGVAEDGEVRALGLRVEGAVDDAALAAIERLQVEHALVFVDWCGCRTGMRAFFADA